MSEAYDIRRILQALPHRYPLLTLGELDGFVEQIRGWPKSFPPRFAEHGVEQLV